MSIREYNASRSLELAAHELDANAFEALVMAGMRVAGTVNLEKLRRAFPLLWQELLARYHAQGGVLPGEESNG